MDKYGINWDKKSKAPTESGGPTEQRSLHPMDILSRIRVPVSTIPYSCSMDPAVDILDTASLL